MGGGVGLESWIGLCCHCYHPSPKGIVEANPCESCVVLLEEDSWFGSLLLLKEDSWLGYLLLLGEDSYFGYPVLLGEDSWFGYLLLPGEDSWSGYLLLLMAVPLVILDY